MKKLAALLGVVILGISANSMRADGIGMPVTGTLNFTFAPSTNYFNGAFGFVPIGYGNNSNDGSGVIVGPGVEFGFSAADLITADFSGNSFTLSQSCVHAQCGVSAYTLTFFTKSQLSYTLQSLNFPGLAYTYNFDPTLNGYLSTITYDGAGLLSTKTTAGSAVFGYTVIPAAVPEPGTISLMATGLLGAAGAIRRRFRA